MKQFCKAQIFALHFIVERNIMYEKVIHLETFWAVKWVGIEKVPYRFLRECL